MSKLNSFLGKLTDKLSNNPARHKKIRARNPHEASIPSSAINSYGNERNEVHEGLVSCDNSQVDFFVHDTDTALGR